MSNVKADDLDILQAAVTEIDEHIAREKRELDQKRWNMVAKKMEEKGTEVYPAKTVEKAFNQMSLTKAAGNSEEVNDEEDEQVAE